jgi:hypothetical protein
MLDSQFHRLKIRGARTEELLACFLGEAFIRKALIHEIAAG